MRPAMEICVDSRAPLVPIGSLTTCTTMLCPSARMRLDRPLGGSPSARLPDIGDMQEGGALQADLDKGRLHAGQDAADAAQVDIADQTAAGRPLDMQFLHDPLLHDGNAGLLRREIDQDFFGHTLYNSRFFLDFTMRKAPRTPRPGRLARQDARRLRFWRRCGLRRPAALQPARAQQRVRRLEQLGEGIAEAHAARQEVLRHQQPDRRTTTSCAPTCATSRRSSP